MAMDWIRTMALVTCGLAVACGDDADPAGGGTEGEDGTSTGAMPPDGTGAVDTGGDTGVATGGVDSGGPATDSGGPADTGGSDEESSGGPPPGTCQPTPTRMVVLGDSITACVGGGGKDSDDCAFKRLNDHLAATYGPITYENLGVGGAVTTDVSGSQIFDIEVGMPGHVIVVIYIGGNDLAQYIFLPDGVAEDGWNNTTAPEVAQAWEEILDFLGDEANFPDGVTLLMNTQYNPFDDCTAPPYFVSELKFQLLQGHNDALTARADSREWAFITDQYPSFLGHGHYVNDSNCPHYDASYEGWLADLIHPNPPGYHNLADMMIETVDQEIYGDCP